MSLSTLRLLFLALILRLRGGWGLPIAERYCSIVFPISALLFPVFKEQESCNHLDVHEEVDVDLR